MVGIKKFKKLQNDSKYEKNKKQYQVKNKVQEQK